MWLRFIHNLTSLLRAIARAPVIRSRAGKLRCFRLTLSGQFDVIEFAHWLGVVATRDQCDGKSKGERIFFCEREADS
jgi:hypothetical protein